MPRQSARITLVNDVNFLLYTPFLPEAAAGMLEPRHVVTPLRDVLEQTHLRLGVVVARDPARRTVTLLDRRAPSTSCATTGWSSPTARSRGCCRSRARRARDRVQEPRRRHLAAQPRDPLLEVADASEDPRPREELLTFVFVGGGYAGLEALAELQDFAAEAIEFYPRARLHGMRWILVEAMDRVLPEIDAELAEYAARELRGRGIDIRLGTTLEEVRPLGTDLDRRDHADAHRCLDRRRRPASEQPATSGWPLDERGGSWSTTTCA